MSSEAEVIRQAISHTQVRPRPRWRTLDGEPIAGRPEEVAQVGDNLVFIGSFVAAATTFLLIGVLLSPILLRSRR